VWECVRACVRACVVYYMLPRTVDVTTGLQPEESAPRNIPVRGVFCSNVRSHDRAGARTRKYVGVTHIW